MTPVLSGAIVYEWTQEVNDYGLIIYPQGTSGTPTPIQAEFDNLKSQWLNASPVGINANAYNPATTSFVCPPTGNGWTLDPSATLPPAPANLTPPPPSNFTPTTHAPYATSLVTASSVIGAVTKSSSTTLLGGSAGTSSGPTSPGAGEGHPSSSATAGGAGVSTTAGSSHSQI
jgi:1,3-beta-glucanosyltransferase GAS1